MTTSTCDGRAQAPPPWDRPPGTRRTPPPGGPHPRGLGFSEHVVVGQIQSLDEGSVAGHQVTNCRVVVNPFQQNRPSRTTWYELSIWDSLAHAFGRQGFRVGDMALFRLDNIRVEAWLDREGQPRATIKAGVDKFLDLRPAAPPPAPAEPGRTPSAEGPGPAGAAPRPRAL